MAEAPARIHAAPVAGFPALPLRDDPLPELFCFLRQDAEFDALWASCMEVDMAQGEMTDWMR